MAGVNRMSDEWQSEAFRMSMVKRLEEAIQEHGLQGQKDPQTMEQQIFMRAKTREDYLNCIARFILMIQSQRNNAGGQLGGAAVTNVASVASGSQINQQDQVGFVTKNLLYYILFLLMKIVTQLNRIIYMLVVTGNV